MLADYLSPKTRVFLNFANFLARLGELKLWETSERAR
jgi:hypothetical protein